MVAGRERRLRTLGEGKENRDAWFPVKAVEDRGYGDLLAVGA